MSYTSETLQKAFHYLFPDEVPALKSLAARLRAEPVVVNIGAGAGTSALTFCEARSDIHLITIDHQKDTSPLGSLASEEEVLRDAGFWDGRVTHHHKDSKEMGLNWPGPKVDMVFIDGGHEYEECKGDIEAWLPNIRSGGIIAVHDFEKEALYPGGDFRDGAPHPMPWPGVDRAVRELLFDHYEQILRVESLIAFRISEPKACEKCGQMDVGQTGEYPCPVCGVPTVWDKEYPGGNSTPPGSD